MSNTVLLIFVSKCKDSTQITSIHNFDSTVHKAGVGCAES